MISKDLLTALGFTEADYERIKVEELEKLNNPIFDYSNLTTLDEVKALKQKEIKYHYKKDLTSEVVSSILGADGNNIVFGYEEIDQLNYSKRANTFALNPALTTCDLGTNSHGVVTLTKDEFLQFMNDCDNHEMSLYMKFADLRGQVEAVTITTDEQEAIERVKAIVW